MKNRYRQLWLLVNLLYDLQKQEAVIQPFKHVLKLRLSSPKYVELMDILIRQITLLMRPYRLKEKGSYVSESEDLVIATQLLHGDLKRETMLNPYTVLALHELKKVFGYDRLFKRKDVERTTGYSKSQSRRLIRWLMDCKRLEKKGGHANRGYYYQLLRVDPQTD